MMELKETNSHWDMGWDGCYIANRMAFSRFSALVGILPRFDPSDLSTIDIQSIQRLPLV